MAFKIDYIKLGLGLIPYLIQISLLILLLLRIYEITVEICVRAYNVEMLIQDFFLNAPLIWALLYSRYQVKIGAIIPEKRFLMPITQGTIISIIDGFIGFWTQMRFISKDPSTSVENSHIIELASYIMIGSAIITCFLLFLSFLDHGFQKPSTKAETLQLIFAILLLCNVISIHIVDNTTNIDYYSKTKWAGYSGTAGILNIGFWQMCMLLFYGFLILINRGNIDDHRILMKEICDKYSYPMLMGLFNLAFGTTITGTLVKDNDLRDTNAFTFITIGVIILCKSYLEFPKKKLLQIIELLLDTKLQDEQKEIVTLEKIIIVNINV
jgi:hypothetical protein